MAFYSRNLPHWQPEHVPVFLTWRLYGSLPCGTVTPDCAPPANESAGRKFVMADRLLDQAKTGPRWLRDPRVASCLIAIIARGTDELHQFQLHAYVIMPNHVHLLITPAVSVTRIMRGIKGISAREANRILSRGGKAFWQDESYDHWVRSEQEFGRIRTYIEMNPVSVGLAKKAEEWPWTSAGKIAW